LVKNGLVQGKQRWLCKSCGFSFTRQQPKGAPEAVKLLAVELWRRGLSQLAIAKIVGYSNVSVGKWLDLYSQKRPVLIAPDKISVIELDELHHYVGKKSGNAGFGLLWMAFPGDSWTGRMALVAPRPFVRSLNGWKPASVQDSTAQTTGKSTARSSPAKSWRKAKR
jgi:transposase